MSTKKEQAVMSADGAVRTHADVDLVSLYMREVEQRRRLSPDEETRLVREMIRRREEITELLRALLLKACDTMGIDSDDLRDAPVRASADATAAASRRGLEEYVAELPALRETAQEGKERRAGDVRSAIATLADKVRLRALERKILDVAEFARSAVRGRRSVHTRREAARSGRGLAADIAAAFGVHVEDLERAAAWIAEKRAAIDQAKRRIVESNLRLVVYFARRAGWSGADVADLIQEGNIALMSAVDSYDPERGVPFGTFATLGVRRAIHRLGVAAGELVRVPEDVRARRRNVRRVADYLSRNGVAPTWESIAAYLEIPKREVAEALGEVEEALELDAEVEDGAPLASVIADPNAIDAEDWLASHESDCLVRAEIARLDERSRRIVEAKYDVDAFVPASLADIGREFGVTRERARQLEARALRALRTGAVTPAQRRRSKATTLCGPDNEARVMCSRFLEREPRSRLRRAKTAPKRGKQPSQSD